MDIPHVPDLHPLANWSTLSWCRMEDVPTVQVSKHWVTGGGLRNQVLWVTPSPTRPPAPQYKSSGARSKALYYQMSARVTLRYLDRGDSVTWMQPPSVTRSGTRLGSPPASPAVCGRGCNLSHMCGIEPDRQSNAGGLSPIVWH